MGNYLNIGTEPFQIALNDIYIDKTGLIDVLNKTINSERRFFLCFPS